MLILRGIIFRFGLLLQGHHVNLQGATAWDVCGPWSSRHDQGEIEGPLLHGMCAVSMFIFIFSKPFKISF